MNKSKSIRLAGFVGAVGLSAALVAAASSSTGAYFTASADGNLSGTSGKLVLSASGTSISFGALTPGVDQSQDVGYSLPDSTTNADIWMVFDSSSQGYGAFTGAKDAAGTAYDGVTGGGLGQYGHFKVAGTAGSFESYNLQLPSVADATQPYSSTATANTCAVDANGHGGSSVQHTAGAGNDLAECGVPAAILLQSNVAAGASGTARVTFGITGKATAQNTPFVNVGYKIVATQHGISPNATW